MRKLKVLPLDSWMEIDHLYNTIDDFMDNQCERLQYAPIMDRAGWYLLGDFCWFVNSIGVWLYEKDSFLYDLECKSLPSLSDKEFMALSAIVKTKLATKTQKTLHGDISHSLNLRKLVADSKKYYMKQLDKEIK